ncbi:MAG: NAD(P)-dependent oxidoreductase [Chloroflexi bacterium]|nr:NAD(P)-dependent oxidoreductase [Chloroflexota bacterium]
MLRDELQQRAASGQPIRIAASGAGWMGSGFAAQMAHVPGMELSVLIDPNLAAARAAFTATGVDAADVVAAGSVGQAMDAINQGKRVITDDVVLAAQLEAIDVMTDVTPSPASGAATAYAAITHGKDVVLINIEADVTVGRALKKLAADAGVLYSVSSGDEPGCLMELYDFVTTLGFEPIVIGKGKNNPLDPTATPDTVAKAARRANKDAYQTASYVDGSKTMFEMTCAANATGCRPMQRGMVGPEADQSTITEIFSLREDGGLAPFPGVVDFVQGTAMAGGVFVTVRVQDDRIADDLKYLKVGNGRYSTFFRPYHLWFIEAPISIARAVMHRQTTLVPLDYPVADVLTIAKRDLRPGERLDDFGGYTFRGLMDTATAVSAENGLPAGLAPGAELIRPVASGAIITWADVRLDESSPVVRLRRLQDQQ